MATAGYRHVAILLVLLSFGRAAAAVEDAPPIVGQPPHFNGAVGRFHVAAAVDRATLQAEDPLTYTVRVTATDDKVGQPPERPALADFAGFAENFYLEDIDPPAGTRPDKKTWEFAYRLKPKSTAVKGVPGFPFVFYRPGFQPPRQGYMTVYAPTLPITVTPREAVAGTAAAKPISGPEVAFALAGGAVLRHDGDDRLPGSAVLVLALLAPPAGCVGWYFAWRRLYPDAARLARRRRSRAAQEALRSLHDGDGRAEAEKQARRAAAAVAGYLRQRLALAIVEPTPAEAAAYLRDRGVSENLAAQTADLLRACAALRFNPEPPPHTDLAGAATRLILALEAETWAE